MQATLYSTTLLMNPFQTLSTLYWTASQHPCHNGHTHWRQRADWLQAGSPCLQGSVGQTPKLDVVCVPPRYRHWLSAVRSCQPSVTELFRSPPLISGTVFHSSHVSTVTGHLSQSPQDSSLQALLSMTSPFSCRTREVSCHYWHINRFCYLLTAQRPNFKWRLPFFKRSRSESHNTTRYVLHLQSEWLCHLQTLWKYCPIERRLIQNLHS